MFMTVLWTQWTSSYQPDTLKYIKSSLQIIGCLTAFNVFLDRYFELKHKK